MPGIECVPCGNRVFSNREALQQHLKTSSAPHPLCEPCGKRFSSESGLEAHNAARHPPTYDCTRCGKSFKQVFALEDHYRGSPNHPNCPRCGKGFKDSEELEIHRNSAHKQVPCPPCGDELVYEDSLERHYAASDRHPSCPQCEKGFRDQAGLDEHLATAHQDVPSSHLENASVSSGSPRDMDMRRDERELGPSTSKFPFAEELSPVSHRTESSANASSSSVSLVNGQGSTRPIPSLSTVGGYNPAASPLSQATLRHLGHGQYHHTGLSSLSPKGHPFKDFASLGSRRIESPDLSRLSMSFGSVSPLLGVQPPPSLSPSGLLPPGREANQIWSSRENIQVPPVNGPAGVAVASSTTYGTRAPGPTNLASSQLGRLGSLSQRPNGSISTTYVDERSSARTSLRSGYNHAYSMSTASLPSMNIPETGSSTGVFTPPLRAASPTRSVASTVVPSNYAASNRPRYSSPSGASTTPSMSPRSTVSYVEPNHQPNHQLLPVTSQNSQTSREYEQHLLPSRLSPPYNFKDARLYPGAARASLRSASTIPSDANLIGSAVNLSYGMTVGGRPPLGSGIPRRSWTHYERMGMGIRLASEVGVESDIHSSSFVLGETAGFNLEENVEMPRIVDSAKPEPEPELKALDSEDLTVGSSSSVVENHDDIYFSSPSAPSTSSTEETCVTSRSTNTMDEITSDMDESTSSTAVLTNEESPDWNKEAIPEWLRETGSNTNAMEAVVAPQITFSLSSASSIFHSPDIGSPIGLARLPSLPSLLETSVDFSGFDLFPEAKLPLPNSPPLAASSPIDVSQTLVNLDVCPGVDDGSEIDRGDDGLADINDSLCLEPGVSQSHTSSPGNESFVTSPQLEELSYQADEVEFGIPESVNQVEEDEKYSPNVSKVDLGVQVDETTPLDLANSNSEISSPTVKTSTTLSSLLYCRECKSDPCDDITATMCGHIFCNRCIVNAVIKTSRCPLCSTPTLLYCLFRLDLEAS